MPYSTLPCPIHLASELPRPPSRSTPSQLHYDTEAEFWSGVREMVHNEDPCTHPPFLNPAESCIICPRFRKIVGRPLFVHRLNSSPATAGKGTNPAKVFSGLSWSRSSRSLTEDSVDFSEQCRLGAHCVTLKKLCDEEQNLYKAVKVCSGRGGGGGAVVR
ncbi:hypothetical protein G4B88_017453 [Cannabis sativa]|uniref:DUF632 domain-containing protein n=1 Tax=Cannabis sativa TaxID=3483 RepID=A0A7J6I4G6_CANSA|nr:hypothetical protein G4B88_017453 [Cannabis sativa]